MFDKILVPIDGSDHSLKALDIAVELAKKFESKLTLIHVYSVVISPLIVPEPPSMTSAIPLVTSTETARIAEFLMKAGKRILSDGKERAKTMGVEVETVLKEGHAISEIIRVAKEDGYNLVVIGARGVSHIREILLGSVSDGVMHHVSCPILVVK